MKYNMSEIGYITRFRRHGSLSPSMISQISGLQGCRDNPKAEEKEEGGGLWVQIPMQVVDGPVDSKQGDGDHEEAARGARALPLLLLRRAGQLPVGRHDRLHVPGGECLFSSSSSCRWR